MKNRRPASNWVRSAAVATLSSGLYSIDSTLGLIRNAANKVKHRNLLTVENNPNLDIVFGELAKKARVRELAVLSAGQGERGLRAR